MKPLLTVDIFRSKAIELKLAYQPLLSLIRKWCWVQSPWEGQLTQEGAGGERPHAPAGGINSGTVQWAITIMAAETSSILLPVTYLVLLSLMIYRGPNGILSPSFFLA